MGTEVLVMCDACGRPQPAAEKCIQCGAILPIEGRPMELDLGGGRKLVLTSENLALQAGPQSDTVPIASIRRAALVQRRVWMFAIGAVLGALFAGYVASTTAKVLVAVMAAFNVWMYLRMREFALNVERKDGATTYLPLGQGGAEKNKTTQAAWDVLSNELSRRGVEIPR